MVSSTTCYIPEINLYFHAVIKGCAKESPVRRQRKIDLVKTEMEIVFLSNIDSEWINSTYKP